MKNSSEELLNELLRKLDMRAIAAMAENGVIGNKNSIPWKIPEEMAFFRRITRKASVLMGRKTFESIGHPLPDRQNIVLTRDSKWSHGGVATIANFEQLLQLGIENTIWVCGGSLIYGELLAACRELYLSIIFGEYAGDATFPEFNNLFAIDKVILSCPTFKVEHYVNRRFIHQYADA
ncbi:MAG: dihydrofolate reductase [Puniceicoccales bacterium]|jgi:dihydrofolate reductase|nr:dihydrofolate reductase [Puniceicoccales bacterium]